eukprot:Clim_evm15s239 gene=Clim_evmTU15s239
MVENIWTHIAALRKYSEFGRKKLLVSHRTRWSPDADSSPTIDTPRQRKKGTHQEKRVPHESLVTQCKLDITNQSRFWVSPTAGSRYSGVKPLNVNRRNLKGETKLHQFAVKGDIEGVQRCLDAGANPNTTDNAGWSPLHDVVNNCSVNIARILLNAGADPNLGAQENGNTALHEAIEQNHMELIDLLVSFGARMDIANNTGLTARMQLSKPEAARLEAVADSLHTTRSTMAGEVGPEASSAQFKDLRIAFTRIPDKTKKKYLRIAADLKFLIDQPVQSASHLVTAVDNSGKVEARTQKYLTALLLGKPIVTPSWLEECIRQSKVLGDQEFRPQADEEFKDPVGYRMLAARDEGSKLFAGLTFWFHGRFHSVSREDWTRLVRLGGGMVWAKHPHRYEGQHAKHSSFDRPQFIVVYDVMKFKGRLQYPHAVAHVNWLKDCISHSGILPLS